MISLRPHQTTGIRLARDAYRAGHRRVLVVAPTGAGKTLIFCWVAASHVAKGGRVLVVVHRRELVRQTVAKMRASGIDRVGVISAGERGDPDAPVQVGSIDTLLARLKNTGGLLGADESLPPATLLVLDEAHHYVADTWGTLPARYPTAKILGVTATPERGDGTPLGDLFDVLVPIATVRELTAAGWLVPCEVIAPPKKTRTDMLDPVEAYVRFGAGRQAVVFAPSVSAAYDLASRFTLAGHPAACVEGDMAAEDRDRVLSRFDARELRVVTNVFVLTEGWDSPGAEVCLLARGCGNVGTYLQMVGRVLRPSPDTGKTSALLIDLRGVVHKHDLPDADRTYSLDGRAISGGDAPMKTCPACGLDCPTGCRTCPACHAEFPSRPPEPEAVLPLSRVARAEVERTYFVEQYERAMMHGSRKPAGYAAHRFGEKFGRFPAKFWREFGGPGERQPAQQEAS